MTIDLRLRFDQIVREFRDLVDLFAYKIRYPVVAIDLNASAILLYKPSFFS